MACSIGDVDKYFYVLPFHKHLEMGSQRSGVLISFIPIISIAGAVEVLPHLLSQEFISINHVLIIIKKNIYMHLPFQLRLVSNCSCQNMERVTLFLMEQTTGVVLFFPSGPK